MTKEELEKVVQGAEYDFLRENPHLGSNIMFLTLGGSHAYGTNVPGSDVDVRGVTGDSKYDLLGFGTFEQVVEQSTDTTIYGFRKLVSLLILHMFDDDMSSVRPSMTVRKVVVVRQNRNSGRVRPTDIEDAMVAKLKPGVNSPTSFNDYNLEFKRDMLPDSVEVKEYTMDNPDGIIL